MEHEFDIESAKSEICLTFRRMVQENLTTSSGGNISVRSNGKILVTPAGKDKLTLQPVDISEIDFDVKTINPDLWNYKAPAASNNVTPTSEVCLHIGVLAANQGYSCVIHAHPVFLSVFSVIREPLNINLLSEVPFLVKQIGIAEYAMPSSGQLAKNVARTAKFSDVVLMRNHGVVAAGNSLNECFRKIEALEHLARVQLLVADRKDVVLINDFEVKAIRQIVNTGK